MELLLGWTVFAVLAALYARARRRVSAASPPRPPAGRDPLELRAHIRIGDWTTGTGEGYRHLLLVDDRHLVLEIRKQRAVVAKADVRALVDSGIFGWDVQHAGEQLLRFSVRRRDTALLHDHLRRHGWPVRDG